MNSEMNFCGCIGYAYIPPQQADQTFPAEEALNHGSLFPELALNICEYGNCCKQEGACQNASE